MLDTTHFFRDYYNNAEVNSIAILDCNGNIIEVNKSFTYHFGYTIDDLAGLHFSILYNAEDNNNNWPQQELDIVISKGQSNDENYIVDKAGNQVWCTGESILVSAENDEKYIVKDIVNLQAKKHLKLFLKETQELLEHIFQSSKEIPMMILDTSLKIEKVNQAFMNVFDLKEAPVQGARLSSIQHPFWANPDVKNELSKILINNQSLNRREFVFEDKQAQQKTIYLSSKIIEQSGVERKIFIILET